MRQLLPLIIFLSIIYGCTGNTKKGVESDYVPTPLDTVQMNINGLNISFDKRMEVLEVIQYLSGSFLVNTQEIKYKERIDSYFSDFKEHPAVLMYAKMEPKGYSYNVPPTTMLSVDNDFNFIKDIDEYYVIRLSGGMRKLHKFYSLLQDFDRETNFNQFMNDNKDIFEASLNMLIDSCFQRKDQIPILEKFYGYGQHSYNIILTPLSIGGYGPRVSAGNGVYDVYDIQGPWSKPVDGITCFGNEDNLTQIVWHEFSHSFVNPLYDKYNEQFMQYQALYEPISKEMSSIGYPTWDIVVYEHVVRAITSFLIAQEYGHERGALALEKEKEKGFIYIDGVYAAIENYATSGKWSDFKQFFPELIEVFKEYSK